jgi:hypothetical protein
MTSTAGGLFSHTVTPSTKYDFEYISGLSLDWIRNNHNLNDRERYKILLEKITEFTPPYDLTEILPNFYEHKDGYYRLVNSAMAL